MRLKKSEYIVNVCDDTGVPISEENFKSPELALKFIETNFKDSKLTISITHRHIGNYGH